MVTVSANRMVKDNNIIEIFTWQPFTRMSVDPERYAYHQIQKLITRMAIHQYGFKLIDIDYLSDKTIYMYEYSNQQPPKIMESKQFEYYPVLGEKTCQVCLNRKIYNGTEYCFKKGKKLKKNDHYRCLEWTEWCANNRSSSCILRQKTKTT